MPRKIEALACKNCGATFLASSGRKDRKYCSPGCSHANSNPQKPNEKQRAFTSMIHIKQKRGKADELTEDEVRTAVREYLEKGGKIDKQPLTFESTQPSARAQVADSLFVASNQFGDDYYVRRLTKILQDEEEER
tara:strand:- start:113 stop:517 length:405 start_codon:yes stop_codon:yes gene_type:complete